MRRRIKSPKTELELFPFLSVLACTIGSLILLIIVVSTQSLTVSPRVKIIAQTEKGKNQSKIPHYIECREDGVILHPSQKFIPLNKLAQSDSELLKLITQVKANRDREYVIVAVRPKGIEVFEKVRDLIEKEQIDIGYEPIEEGWNLQLKNQ
jgi:hypothetical protein